MSEPIIARRSTPEAYEGHDHEASPAPVGQTTLPRAETSSDAFELLVLARDATLLIYLDRFRTNEPVEGAAIQVDTPSGSSTATAEPGEPYRLEAPWLRPGRHDLLFTVTAGTDVDVLTTTLVVPESAAEAAGLREGDIITEVDGRPVNETKPLDEHIGRYEPGDRVELTILRDGRKRDISVRLGSQPIEPPVAPMRHEDGL